MQSLANMEWGNQSIITEFILLGFETNQELRVLLFLVFLAIYFLTVAGNILVIVLVAADQHLQTPMYFFLGNLSWLEICYTSTTLPRLLADPRTGDRNISATGCITQLYLFSILVAAECYLLAAMSYDRYLAICKPLHYATIMNGRFCLQLTAGSWISAFLAISIIISFVSQLTFCGPNQIDHFFCEFHPVVKLSCDDTKVVEFLAFLCASIFTGPSFLLTIISYGFIIAMIQRIPSATGKQKAFSTCSSHLIVVTTFYGTLMIVYVLPKSKTLTNLNKLFSVFYTVLTPLLNPLIYSLRNKDVKQALKKIRQYDFGFAKNSDNQR
ncbi:olfactory receptor 2AP1-like [Carettochelys insculpta]|uniref:olfactory receptor 2AP1-like n=1 Tax=Carettochelys insculpta TaxID=44489 RepID=UPI003EBCF4DC